MRALVFAGIISLFAAPLQTYAQFQVDLSSAELRARNGTPGLIDLAVGEVGLMGGASFCTAQNGSLMIYATSPLATERSEYGITWEVKRESGGTVSMRGIVGAKATTAVPESLARQFVDQRACDPVLFPPDRLMPVSTIDGFSSASALISD